MHPWLRPWYATFRFLEAQQSRNIAGVVDGITVLSAWQQAFATQMQAAAAQTQAAWRTAAAARAVFAGARPRMRVVATNGNLALAAQVEDADRQPAILEAPRWTDAKIVDLLARRR